MNEEFLTVLQTYNLAPGDGVVLACSGGSDSMAMVALFAETQAVHNLRLVVGHVNHGLRPLSETAKDEAVVRTLAAKYSLDIHVAHCDPKTWKIVGASLEAIARQQRYEKLQEFLQQSSCQYIALAHNYHDQIETVYMRLMQHYGLAGLAGIPSKRGDLIRPILPFSKDQLRKHLEEKSITWSEDSTNASDVYLRNKVRNELETLEQYKPGFAAALGHLAEESRNYVETLDILMQDLYQHEKLEEDGIVFPLDIFLQQPKLCQHKLLYRWFNKLMRGHAPADFRLPGRFLKTLQLGGAGPVMLRGYGIILTKKKKLLYFKMDRKNID